MSTRLLENIAWHSLAGPHAHYATGTAVARRYARGFMPIVGFADVARPGLRSLRAHCKPGESVFSLGWSGAASDGWQIERESTVLMLVWDAPLPAADPAFKAVRLGREHLPQMTELVAATLSRPLGARAVELGEHWGCFEGPRLVAMAGERMRAGTLREIGSVCTHPGFRSRGFARGLIRHLVRREMQRDETPFLHVRQDNAVARRLYEGMGFRRVHQAVARVMSPRP
jgi:GNAT superfamily N-acetyltransferase